MEPGANDADERTTPVASVLMTKALEDGAEITAEAYGAKPAALRGATTCAGKRCGVPVVYQRAHRRPHRNGYVEMFAGFRLATGSQHATTCDIDVQMGAKRRGLVVRASKIVAAAAILTMAMDPQGKGRVVDERLLRVRWDAPDTPPRITIATPSATLAAASGRGSGGGFVRGGARRPKRITRAADVEAERRKILHDDDPKAAARQLSIQLGDDPVPIGWNAFFHNWEKNTAAMIERIVKGIEDGAAGSGVAFAAKVARRPTYRHGTWNVPCRVVFSADGTRAFSLWMAFTDRAVANGLVVGTPYVFAGPEVRFERVVRGGMTYENVSVAVLSDRWVTDSEEVRPEELERLRRTSA
jgi:hypothetical protein